MAWTKSPASLVATFESVTPGPPVQSRKMFGYPAAFVNGHMFMSLFQDDMILRLPEEARAEIAGEGGRPFEPMKGRPMREYVVLPASLLKDRAALGRWVARALAYGESLPPKAKKRAAAKSTSRRPARRPR